MSDSKEIKESTIFETTNVDLASFLSFNGIKLLETQIKDIKRNLVVLRFLDEKRNCLDLEQVYLNSDFKRFRDINKYLLRKVHEVVNKERSNGPR